MLPRSLDLTRHDPQEGTAMEAFVQVSSFNLQTQVNLSFLSFERK